MQDIIDYNNGAFNKYNTEGLTPCENCGRTFKYESLKAHQKHCTKEKPMARTGQG